MRPGLPFAALLLVAGCGARGTVVVKVATLIPIERLARLHVDVLQDRQWARTDVPVDPPRALLPSQSLRLALVFERGRAGLFTVEIQAFDPQAARVAVGSVTGRTGPGAQSEVEVLLHRENLPVGDGGIPDLATADRATNDRSMGDLASADLSILDLATADLSIPDLATADLSIPDLATVDLATVDLATVDLSTTDLAADDLATPDLAMVDLVAAD